MKTNNWIDSADGQRMTYIGKKDIDDFQNIWIWNFFELNKPTTNQKDCV